MSAVNTGGPAFPTMRLSLIGDVVPDEEGMTLRDYFAAKAMESLCVMPQFVSGLDKAAMNAGVPFKAALAQHCYEMADAMLAARQKRGAA